jgi:hypothetical protein
MYLLTVFVMDPSQIPNKQSMMYYVVITVYSVGVTAVADIAVAFIMPRYRELILFASKQSVFH